MVFFVNSLISLILEMDVYAAELARGHHGYRSKKNISAVLMFDTIQYSNTSQA